MGKQESNLAQWASEYPHLASLIHIKGLREVFASSPPPKEKDETWEEIIAHIGPVSEISTGNEP